MNFKIVILLTLFSTLGRYSYCQQQCYSNNITITGQGSPYCANDTVTLSIMMDNENTDNCITCGVNETLSYTWTWRNNGTIIPLEGNNNSDTLTVTLIQGNNTFDVEVCCSDSNDNSNCQSSATATSTIDVRATPTVALNGLQSSYCVGDALNIRVVGGGATSCTWISSSMPTNSITGCELMFDSIQAGAGGQYTLKFTGANMCPAPDTMINIEVNERMSLTLLGNQDTVVCQGTSPFSLRPSGGDGRGSYVVTVDGMPTGNFVDVNGMFGPSDPGTYTVTYSEEGCTSDAVATIRVLPLPMVTFNPIDTLCGNDDEIDLSEFVTPFGDSVGVFGFNGMLLLNSNNLFDPANGTGTLTYAYTDGNGCMNNASTPVVVNAPPDINTGDDLNICQGADATLSVNVNASYTYEWDNGRFLSDSTTATPSLNSTLGAGSTTFSVTVTDGNNCQSKDTLVVNVNPQPSVEISLVNSACVNGSANLEAVVVGNNFFNDNDIGYSWSNSQNTTNMITTDPLPADSTVMYSVEVTFPLSSGCATGEDSLGVTAKDTPMPSLRIIGDTTICKGTQSVVFVSNRITGSTLDWESDVISPDALAESEETSTINWPDNIRDNGRLIITESLNGGCMNSDTLELTFVEGGDIPETAAIFRSPVNNILVYNDSTACRYQWGFFKEGTNTLMERDSFQSYVPENFDPEATYWCLAVYEDESGACNGCSTLARYKSRAIQDTVVVEEPSRFKLYPNPSVGQLFLEVTPLLPDTEYELRIFNSIGQLVQSAQVQTSGSMLAEEIDMTTSAAGVYHLVLVYRGEVLNVRSFVLQR